MKHIFIINPAAGAHGATDELRRELSEIGTEYDWEIYQTKAPRDATEYVKARAAADPRTVLRFYACGGDGTLNEVVNGAVGFPNVSVSCYACGSGNDFVKVYGGLERFRDVRGLLSAEEEAIDLIRVGDKYSINVTNFGFDTCVAKTMTAVRRKRIIGGKNAYTTGIVKAIFSAMNNKCVVEADGEVLNPKERMLLCTVSNGQYVGGSFRCAPKSSNKDGELEVCLFKPVSLFRFLKLLPVYTEGNHLDEEHLEKLSPIMVYRRAKSIRVTAPEGFAYTLDGEIVEENEFVMEVVPAALRFAVPHQPVPADRETPAEESASV